MLALAHTPAAAIAAAGGGWVAIGSEEYELMAVNLARKRAGKMRLREGFGSVSCGDTRRATAVLSMARVRRRWRWCCC